MPKSANKIPNYDPYSHLNRVLAQMAIIKTNMDMADERVTYPLSVACNINEMNRIMKKLGIDGCVKAEWKRPASTRQVALRDLIDECPV